MRLAGGAGGAEGGVAADGERVEAGPGGVGVGEVGVGRVDRGGGDEGGVRRVDHEVEAALGVERLAGGVERADVAVVDDRLAAGVAAEREPARCDGRGRRGVLDHHLVVEERIGRRRVDGVDVGASDGAGGVEVAPDRFGVAGVGIGRAVDGVEGDAGEVAAGDGVGGVAAEVDGGVVRGVDGVGGVGERLDLLDDDVSVQRRGGRRGEGGGHGSADKDRASSGHCWQSLRPEGGRQLGKRNVGRRGRRSSEFSGPAKENRRWRRGRRRL